MKQVKSETDLWWRNLSPENTKKLLEVIDLILSKIEINGLNRLIAIKVPKSEFEDKGIKDFDEAITIVSRLSKDSNLFKVANDDFTIRLLRHDIGTISDRRTEKLNEDLKDNLVFRIIDLAAKDELIKIKLELEQSTNIKTDNSQGEVAPNKTDKDEAYVNWPTSWGWTDSNTYNFGGQGAVSFMSKNDNKTKIYFEMMVDSKDWVEVATMRKRTKEPKRQIRIKLSQIRKKLVNQKLKQIIKLEAREKRSEVGAYRLIPLIS
jgi:hypothetical protein